MSSRNQGYDSGESRRSPRDRSPGRYNDPRDEYRDRGGAMRGSERRRSSIPDSRANHNTFASNRENFREPMGRDSSRDFPPRDIPRGPKGLIDAPTGPRGNSYNPDFRGDFAYRGDFRGGRGRGGRGRGWRDDSRDRGRELDRDYRDRRDDRCPPREPFREDRGRDRDRWERDPFRGRRASSPQGRGRSPNYGSRDMRDAPPPSDGDRTRRGSRDGPLPAGSSTSESLLQFGRGYGRARSSGRGRGRGGYYEDYLRQPGRSRSPDPNWNRRTQPSATPPPQVPAFGSGPAPAAAPAPGVAIPTAPRSHKVPQGRGYSKATTLKVDNSLKPASTPPAATTPASDEKLDVPSNALHDASALQTRKRQPVVGKREPNFPAAPVNDATDDGSDSDSGEFGDEYFEDEIKKTEDDITKAADNPLVPPAEPMAVFFKPLLEYTIDDIIAAHKPVEPDECTAPVEKTSPFPAPPTTSSTLAPKQKAKGKSRSATPLLEVEGSAKPATNSNSKDANRQPELDTTTKPRINPKEPILQPELEITTKARINSKDAGRESESQGPEPTPEPAKGRQAPSIIVPPANEKSRDLPDQVLGGPKPPPNPANGRKPMMDQFDDTECEQSEAERLEELAAVRKQMKTPPISSLPKFNCMKWDKDLDFVASLERQNPIVEEEIRKHIRAEKEKIAREQEEEKQRWKERYFDYRMWTDFSDDPVAVRSREKFAKSRAQAAAEAAAPPPSAAQTTGVKPEGQRRTGSRFATEHDFERVLRESEQEAKETKEREERAARARTASAKEATIPDMCWNDEEWNKTKCIDRTHLVPFERSFAILEFGEPIDNFVEEEAEIFERVYLDFPKQWTKIADALPRRDYKACIQHYYLVKHSSNLKEKLKKHSKKKKGRVPKASKPKSSSLMADLRDDVEDGQDNENGERRRPRRAAAPTWPIETPQSESEVASPAPTPGRKSTAAPKGDAGSEQAPPKKRAKGTREKASTKQAKNSQLLAAAPIAAANRRDASPATPAASTEWKGNRRPSAGPSRFPPQYDGAADSRPTFAPPYIPPERAITAMPMNFDPTPQPYPTQERLDSAPPVNFDPQQDRRNTQQTSSYWSVPETTDFPALLKHFGTDWHGVAKFMTSKTHIMVYKSVFQRWLAVPSDSNKSRLVANILTQVKNYYLRQVDSGTKKEWEEFAQEADAKRSRGEPTGPLPQPTVATKRRYDVTSGPLPRAGSTIDGLDDMPTNGQGAILAQASPPQPQSLSSRFPALAQAGPVPHQPAQPPALNKHLTPQPIQQAPPQAHQQPRPSRGPALGYFHTDRPILQNDSVSQRSLQVSQEAHMERNNALRLENEQREQQQQQQQAMQRERQLQMKQENDVPNPHQFEPYSTPPVHPGNMALQSRPDVSQSQPPPTDLRRSAPPPQQQQQTQQQPYQPRSHQAVRNLISDNTGGSREIKSSPSPAVPRAPTSAPPASHEPYSTPPQPVPIAAARQQETVRKTSNLMALLNNDEPSDPRPAPVKRVSDVSTSSLHQTSQTPPPQHPLQSSRYVTHPSQPTSQPPQQMPQQMAHQPSAPQLSQAQHPYSHPSPHPIHQHSSSMGGHPRSYTPTGFDGRPYAPPPSMQQQPQQQMFAQPPRQTVGSHPSSLRREPSLGEVHGVTPGYARGPAPSQPSMRLKESPYSATPPTGPQTGRQQVGSPLDLAPPSDREFYPRQQQYLMQQPSSAAASPQLGPSYHQPQQQQPSHRQLAFGQAPSHTASPPTSFATQRPVQRSRQNSFDGARYSMPATSAPPHNQHGFAQPPQHQPSHMSIQYQQPPQPGRDRIDYERERRLQQEDYERRLQDEAAYRRHLDERR